MKPDERQLLAAIQQRGPEHRLVTVRHIIEALDMNPKRAEYILTKWSRKGWYSWGAVIDLGWLTDAGKVVPIQA